ncbi:hypothetical protein [Leisingera sp. ANG-DT]|uniref:hypothetical protein n=1 Tax=Leisingera sp. ANG-DT TaxID=1577897 RepID=UPI0019D38DA7|nr:hypothetical protein [Leisingera sp. ANG-DT]
MPPWISACSDPAWPVPAKLGTQQAAEECFYMTGHITIYTYENKYKIWMAEWLASPEVADLSKISSADRGNMPAHTAVHTFSK